MWLCRAPENGCSAQSKHRPEIQEKLRIRFVPSSILSFHATGNFRVFSIHNHSIGQQRRCLQRRVQELEQAKGRSR
jgi:hypothetical protein